MYCINIVEARYSMQVALKNSQVYALQFPMLICPLAINESCKND
jgi:hypothetical protein